MQRVESVALYRAMLRIRKFEEALEELVSKGVIGGTTHLCIGQEAVPAGVSLRMHEDDLVVSTHRGHGHLLAKGARADRMLAEIAGRASGYCQGKGGSQHCAVLEIGHMGSNGITGGGLPVAAGLALSLVNSGRCVICYLGDGAAATGNFHETLNLASLWNLPLVFVLENNGYAMSTSVSRYASCKSFVEWADRYVNMATAVVDGNDAIAVSTEVLPLLDRARSGGGPGFIECKTYRMCGHSKSDPRNYRSREEESRWRARDPIELLAAEACISEAEIRLITNEVESEIGSAVAFAMQEPQENTAANTEIALGDLDVLYAPPTVGHSHIAAGHDVSFTEALRDVLGAEMERDPTMFLLGEDIGEYGGAFGVTRGLLARFGPERVRETPICENSFVGMAVGAAMGGMRPVAELMFGDFVTCCMDALVNHAAKLRYMYAGQVRLPFTLRLPVGRRHGYGATHSQSLESWFLHVPGLRVVFPATVNDAVGLLRTAIRSDEPVLFFEHKLLYPERGPMPPADYTIPLGRACVDREGSDLTMISYGHALSLCREAAEQLSARGVSAEIINLRSLAPLDAETCLTSIRKTRRLLFVQEATIVGGVCDRVIAELLPQVHECLLAPPGRVGAEHCPIPSSPELENVVMPSVRKVLRAALALVANTK
ncbi:MAG: thiamine pyrophosphate-dependent enzyme [Planctomycetota bacterium]